MNFVSFMLAVILYMVPLHKNMTPETDTVSNVNRYIEMANDFAEVCQDIDVQPLFSGPRAREKTCVLAASVAVNESGLSEEIDSGDKKGDHGRSACIMQIQSGNPKNGFPYTQEYLLSNRKVCIRSGIEMIRKHWCGRRGPEGLLRGYMSGSCRTYTEDPVKERIVSQAARDEISGYMSFFGQNPVLPQVKVVLRQPNYDVQNAEALVVFHDM